MLKALMEAYPENWNSSPKTPPDPEAPQAIADVKDPLRIRPMLPSEILLQSLAQACPDPAECLGQAIADVKDPLRIRPMLPFEILLQALPQACPDHAECLEPKARGISLHTQARTHTRGMNRS